MAFYKLGCIGRHDFDPITDLAKKRFVEGTPLATLECSARSAREKEEAKLITNMEVTPMTIRNVNFACKHAEYCSSREHCACILSRMLDHQLH